MLHSKALRLSKNPKNWGKYANLDLHGWAFDRFETMLAYKAEMEGIAVETDSERDTSKSCIWIRVLERKHCFSAYPTMV